MSASSPILDSASMQLRNLRNNQFALRLAGTGTPFIWGHGLMTSMQVDDQAGMLDWQRLEATARVIRYDARGHGESGGSDSVQDYRWENQAQDLWAVADSCAPGENVVLGGASMGTAVALHAAMQRPEQVAGLVLVLPPTAWETRAQQAKLYQRLARLIGVVGRISRGIAALFTNLENSGDARRRLGIAAAQQLGRAHPPYMKNALNGAAQSDLPPVEALEQLEIPTLILTWAGDSSHPVSTARVLNAHLPEVQIYRVSNEEEVSDWTGYIEDFLLQISCPQRNI